MSLDIIKSVFQNLNTGTNWSLQLLNIKTSKRTGTGYSSRQIILTPNERLAILVNDIAAIYNGNGKKAVDTYRAVREYDGTAEYLLSYILPLFAFDFTVWNEVILFLIFFSVFAFLSIRHNHFSVNVLLELMQYRFYSCELENEDGVSISKTVVCKETLSAQVGGTILVRAINNEYVVKLSEG